MNTEKFLAELYRFSEGYTYLWTRQKKRTYQFPIDDLQAMVACADEQSRLQRDVYFGVCTTQKSLGDYDRTKNEDISSISALWVDIDIADGNHAAKNLPPDVMSARSLLPTEYEPSIVVFSGHGLHAYYLLKEAWELDSVEQQAQASRYLRRLQGAVRARAAEHGWHIDAVSDLARVLRLPGTKNYKDINAPIDCVVIEANEPVLRYNVSDFDSLPEIASDVQTDKRAGGFERRETDEPVDNMLANCAFLTHWQLHYKTLTEPVWMAACTNLIRGVGGEDIVLAAARDWLGDKYNEAETKKKIQHWLDEAHPTTCQFIQNQLDFKGCYQGCRVKSPCCWSLEKVPKALAKVRRISSVNGETVFAPETLGALAILEKGDPAEYARFRERCKGHVNLNDLRKAVKEERIRSSNLEVIDGAGAAMLQPGQQLGDLTTCRSVPDTPLDLAVPAGFTFTEGGIEQIKRQGDGLVSYQAAGVPVILSERIYNLDTRTEKVEIAFRYFNQWARVVRRRSEVFSAKNIVSLTDWGLNMSSESAKYLVKFLQGLESANGDRIPLVYAVSKVGWRGEEDFVIPGEKKYRVDMEDEGEVTEAFTVRGSLDEWKKVAVRIRSMPFARFVLAAAFAAPLLKVCRNRNFMVYFWGTSGGGKTASQVFALSVWGSPNKLMKSFYGTTNGIERALTYSNDFPLVINEKQVMIGKDKQNLLEQLVYMLEGGRGKVRASKTGMQKTATWRSIGMASGEEPISRENSIQGVKTRLLELNVYPVINDDTFAKSLYTLSEEHCGHAGPLFVHRLLEESKDRYHEVQAAYHALGDLLRQQFPEHFAIHIDNVALIALADCLYSQWLMGVPKSEAEQAAYEMAIAVLNELPTQRQISDVERGWDYVQSWLAAHDSRFEVAHRELKVTPSYGFKKDGCTYVYPEFFRSALRDAGFSPEKLIREFANMGRIGTETNGTKKRFQVSVRFGSRKFKCIKIIEES